MRSDGLNINFFSCAWVEWVVIRKKSESRVTIREKISFWIALIDAMHQQCKFIVFSFHTFNTFRQFLVIPVWLIFTRHLNYRFYQQQSTPFDLLPTHDIKNASTYAYYRQPTQFITPLLTMFYLHFNRRRLLAKNIISIPKPHHINVINKSKTNLITEIFREMQ